MSFLAECHECKGTGKSKVLIHWFVHRGEVTPKIELADGQYRDLTEDELIEAMKIG